MEQPYEFEEIPDEEKLTIARQFMLSSPPGQFHQVVKDLKNILPSHLLSENFLEEVAREFHLKVSKPIQLDDVDYKFVVCKDGEVDGTHYIDTRGKRVIPFNHFKEEVELDAAQPLPSNYPSQYESYREALEAKLVKETKSQFSNQASVAVYACDSSTLVVMITAERINLRNFWSGKWTSRWEVDMSSQPSKMKGNVKIHAHYFENGNLQLQSSKDVEKEIDYKDENSFATRVANAIDEEETLILQSMTYMYGYMTDETFKEMRRVMPVTQTKMDWRLSTHRTARDLTK